MADLAAMNIVIGANVTNALQGLEHLSAELADLAAGGQLSINKLNAALDTLRQHAKDATDVGQIAKYNKAIEQLTGEVTKLKNVGSGGFDKIKASSNSAATALGNLGRVAQDAPFGFVAISNNLNPLLESFQRLKDESGSTGGALKAMASSLGGAGGLGLALSAVTAIMTVVQIGFRAWTGSSKEAKDSGDEFSGTLKNIARDAQYLKTNLDNVTASLHSMQGVWSAQNKVRFFGDDEQASLVDAKNNLAFVIQSSNDLNKAAQEASDNVSKASQARLDIINQYGKDSEQAKKAEQDYNAVLKVQTDITEQQTKKVDELKLARTGEALAQIQYNKKLADDAAKKIADQKKAFDEANKWRQTKDKFQWLIPDFNLQVMPKLSEKTDTLQKQLQGKLDIKPLLLSFELPDLSEGTKLQKDLEALTNIIKDTIVNSLSTIGESLGEALAGEKNPFAPVLAVLSEGLKTLGKAYIQIGVEALIASKALKLLMSNPYLTIAAGIALVALGSLLQSKLQGVKAFATGGVVTRPTLALIGEQGPEQVMPLGWRSQSSNNMMQGEVVFQISGQTLRGILRRADQTAYNTF